MTTKKAASAKTSVKRTPTKKDLSTRANLGSFELTDADNQTHKCSGACGQVLAVRKFPTTKVSGVRVGECRACRDARTKKGASRRGSK